MFVGRIKEMKILNEKFESDHAEFIVIYGRRRIGKTALIREFLKNKKHIFYSAVQVTDSVQLSKASDVIIDYFGKNTYTDHFSDWEKLLNYINDHTPDNEKLVIAIDEFPYIAQNNSSVASIIQKKWDLLLSQKNIMLIISGSSMRFMEQEVLSEKNPLYGRATSIMKLNELPFKDARAFMGDGTYEEHLNYYSVFSGVPYYLNMIDKNRDFETNLCLSVLRSSSVLFNEAEFLLKQELREVAQYNAIIESVAHGDTRLNDIFMKTGIEKSKLPYYIGNLMDLGIIKREFPANMKIKEQQKSRSGLYKIDNSFFRFYYAFVYPYISALQEGLELTIVEEVIRPNLNKFVSEEFEKVSRQQLNEWAIQNKLPIKPIVIGRWWEKNQEIDILAMDLKGNCIFGDCKWRNEKMDVSHYNILKSKSAVLNKSSDQSYYILFSKSGFTEELLKCTQDDAHLILCDYSSNHLITWGLKS